MMHKVFYASGFLYHPASERILLQQQNQKDATSVWSMLGSQNQGKETSAENFRRLVRTLLKIKLPLAAVRSVYNYHHPVLKKEHYVSYAEVKKLVKFPPKKDVVFAWFTIKEIGKLTLSVQTKQDIIVGQRVINSQIRRNAGEQTIG